MCGGGRWHGGDHCGPVAGVPPSVATATLTRSHPATGSEHIASKWIQPSQPYLVILTAALQVTSWSYCCIFCDKWGGDGDGDIVVVDATSSLDSKWSRWHVSLMGGWPGCPHWMVAASGSPHPGGAGWAPWGTPWWPGSPSRCCRTPWQTWWTSSSGASVPQVVQNVIKKFGKIVFLVFMCSGLNIYWAKALNDKIAS